MYKCNKCYQVTNDKPVSCQGCKCHVTTDLHNEFSDKTYYDIGKLPNGRFYGVKRQVSCVNRCRGIAFTEIDKIRHDRYSKPLQITSRYNNEVLKPLDNFWLQGYPYVLDCYDELGNAYFIRLKVRIKTEIQHGDIYYIVHVWNKETNEYYRDPKPRFNPAKALTKGRWTKIAQIADNE